MFLLLYESERISSQMTKKRSASYMWFQENLEISSVGNMTNGKVLRRSTKKKSLKIRNRQLKCLDYNEERTLGEFNTHRTSKQDK